MIHANLRHALRPGLQPAAPTAAARRRAGLIWLSVLALIGFSGCALPSVPGPPSTAGAAPPTTSAAAPASVTAASVMVLPGTGISTIRDDLEQATRTIDVTMYELRDTTTEAVLAAAAGRGVRVRVILDGGGERDQNLAAASYLSSHGVDIHWSSPSYRLTHQKTITVDSTYSLIMTLNLVSDDYADTRDVAVVDRDPRDVAAIEAVFAADLDNRAISPSDGDSLIWSPGSEAALAQLIGSAHQQLLVETEEMSDSGIISALIAAARRGVAVTVVMTDDSEWQSAFTRLAEAGVVVMVVPESAPLYIHAKLIVSDPGDADARVFVGSENFTASSLDDNRELGTVVSAAAAVSQLASVIRSDAARGQRWS